jgi:hypothetical protein
MTQTQPTDCSSEARLADFVIQCRTTAEIALASGHPTDLADALASILVRAQELSAAPPAGRRRGFKSKLASSTPAS